MSDLANTLDLIERQRQSYRAMYRVTLRQRECIECEDIEGLNRSFDEIHRTMGRVRMQVKLQDLDDFSDGDRSQIRAANEKLRKVIGEIEHLRQANVQSIQVLMERTRGELRHFGRGRRAVKGYTAAAVGEARFFDGTR